MTTPITLPLPLALELELSHLFVDIGGLRYLLDTGAAKSFSSTPELSLFDRRHELPVNCMGFDAAQLGQAIGIHVDGLLGMDVLGELEMLIDIPGARLTLSPSDNPLVLDGQRLAVEMFMDIMPMIEVDIGGNVVKVFFDTGAQISYLDEALVTRSAPGSVLRDFYPGFGEFETEVAEVRVRAGAVELSLRCGILPELLGLSLGMMQMLAGARGVVGNELIGSGRALLSPPQGHLTLAHA
jgi:hypothetical protein